MKSIKEFFCACGRHWMKNHSHNFIDSVSGKTVYNAECHCGKKWMVDSLNPIGGSRVEKKHIKKHMTKEQTEEEIIEKYGDVMMHFKTYYHFIFTFKGTSDNRKTNICVCCGGSPDQIINMNISSDEGKPLKEFFSDQYKVFISIWKDGTPIYDYSN